jgi:hypothetical protein
MSQASRGLADTPDAAVEGMKVSTPLTAGHRPWVSAKGAVDNDLVQRALEQGELLIVELDDEQP